MTTAVIAFTRRGAALGRSLADALGGSLHVPARVAPEGGAEAYSSLEGWTAWAWARADALVFVGAAGIAVRAIAPHVRDKFSDPAVVSVDEVGRFVVPLLSGHVGGANELARRVAALTGGQAAVSTATDVNGLFAVDVWARERGMAITDRVLAKEVSAALLEGRPVGFASDFGHPCPEGLTAGPAERLTQAADARRRGALGTGFCAGHHKIDRRQPARLPALAFGKACKALPRTAARPRRKRAVSTCRAELRRAECQRRFPVKYRRVPPGEPLAGVRLRCGACLRCHHAAPDALFLLGIDRICQSDSLLPSIL